LNIFFLSAQQNFPYSLLKLANMLEHGRGVDIDLKKSEEYLKKAANTGFFEAQYSYANHLILQKYEFRLAVHYLSLSLQQGYKYSLPILSMLYCSGLGVEIDFDKGVELIKEALKCGVTTKVEIKHHKERLEQDQTEGGVMKENMVKLFNLIK